MKIIHYKALLITFLWVAVASSSYHALASGEHITSELFKDNPFPVRDKDISGVYLAAGGDRSFVNAAFATEAGIRISHMAHFDTNPLVLSFVETLRSLMLSSNSANILYEQALHISSVPWGEYIRKKVNNRLFYSRSIYNDQELFNRAQDLAKEPSESFKLNINDMHTWQGLADYLKEGDKKIAVIDLSNRVSYNKMSHFFDSFKKYFDEETVVLQAYSGGYKYRQAHYKTICYKLSDLMENTGHILKTTP